MANRPGGRLLLPLELNKALGNEEATPARALTLAGPYPMHRPGLLLSSSKLTASPCKVMQG